MAAQPDERFTIRRKVLKLFGAAFHVYDAQGELVAFCKQKAFKLREDIRLYTDESLQEEFLTLGTKQIIDFGVTFDVRLPDGTVMASIRRKGLRSMLRDTWQVYGPNAGIAKDTAPIATIQEDSAGLAFLRRFIEAASMFLPQKFMLKTADGRTIATYRTHFNPFVYRMGVTVHEEHAELDELTILAAGCLLAAIEGRQN